MSSAKTNDLTLLFCFGADGTSNQRADTFMSVAILTFSSVNCQLLRQGSRNMFLKLQCSQLSTHLFMNQQEASFYQKLSECVLRAFERRYKRGFLHWAARLFRPTAHFTLLILIYTSKHDLSWISHFLGHRFTSERSHSFLRARKWEKLLRKASLLKHPHTNYASFLPWGLNFNFFFSHSFIHLFIYLLFQCNSSLCGFSPHFRFSHQNKEICCLFGRS